jgi:hypothetical protein
MMNLDTALDGLLGATIDRSLYQTVDFLQHLKAEDVRALRLKKKALVARRRREGPGNNRRFTGLSKLDSRRAFLRKTLRCLNLAKGFLRGRAYLRIENSAKTAPDWAEVFGYVRSATSPEEFQDWANSQEGLPTPDPVSVREAMTRRLIKTAETIEELLKMDQIPEERKRELAEKLESLSTPRSEVA